MKVALCLSGLLREYKSAWQQSLKPMFADKYNADVFISVWDDVGYWSPGDSKTPNGFFSSGKVSKQELCDLYKTDNVIVENFEEIMPILDKKTAHFPEFFIEAISHSNFMARRMNTTSLFYKKKSVVDLMVSSKNNYDLVIRTRPDICFHKEWPTFNPFNFYTIEGLIHGQIKEYVRYGINDNFQASSMENIFKYTRVYDRLEELFLFCNKIFCPHIFSLAILDINNIERVQCAIPYSMLHTPHGQYFTPDISGEWKHVSKANYDKKEGRFQG